MFPFDDVIMYIRCYIMHVNWHEIHFILFYLRTISHCDVTKTNRWHHNCFHFGNPDSKVHGANMGSTWVLSAPDGPHVGPMNCYQGTYQERLDFNGRIFIHWKTFRCSHFKPAVLFFNGENHYRLKSRPQTNLYIMVEYITHHKCQFLSFQLDQSFVCKSEHQWWCHEMWVSSQWHDVLAD